MSEFFLKGSKSKRKKILCVCVGGGGGETGGGARVSESFLQRI